MGSHAVGRPLDLTDPAPLKVTASPGAHHVHAASRPLSRGTTLGTGFRQDPDRRLGGFVGRVSGTLKDKQSQNVIRATLSSLTFRSIW